MAYGPGLVWVLHSLLGHRFDLLAQPVADKLAEIEASNGRVTRGQSGLIVFHAAVAELAALFGMADQGLDSGAAARKAGESGALALRERGGIEALFGFSTPC